MKTWQLGGLLLVIFGTLAPALAVLAVRYASRHEAHRRREAYHRGYQQAGIDYNEWERARVRRDLEGESLAEDREHLATPADYADAWVDQEFEAIRRRMRSA